MSDDKTLNYSLNRTGSLENAFSVILTEGNENMDKIDELLKTQENSLKHYVDVSGSQYAIIEEEEQVRQANEITRGISEENRTVTYERQIYESAQATENANIASDKANAISVWEDFSSLKAYIPLNKVSFNGDSYINIIACTGIYPTNTTNWTIISEHGRDGFSSILESKFTATANNTTHIVHGIVGYDSTIDNLQCYDNYTGGVLEKGVNYTENTDKLSIDLIGWSINIGEIISFKLYKNLNEDTIQTVIDNSIIAKGNLDNSVINANTTKINLQNVIATADTTTYATVGNVGNKALLATQDKTNLVNAINENTSKLVDITKFKLIADINATTYLNGNTIDFSWIRNQQSILFAEFYRKLIKSSLVKICCNGDSLTYGQDTISNDKRVADPLLCPNGSAHVQTRASVTYPEALQEYLRSIYGSDKVNIINRGYSGDWLEASYNRWYTKHDSDLTILMFGTNDSRATWVPNDIRGDIQDYVDWYEQTIIREIVWGKAVIILTPPKLAQANDLDIQSYMLPLKMMADKYGVPVVNSSEFTANYPSTIYSDGVHFNTSGYRVFASKVSALFIGNGVINPYIIGDGDILLTRPNVDSIKLYGNSLIENTISASTPDEVNSTTGITVKFTNVGSGIIYGFYAEVGDLMLLPFFYSTANNLKVTLDFNTVAPRNANDYIVDASMSLSEVLPKEVIYNFSTATNSLADLIKATGDNAQPVIIRISEKGWHTIKIEPSISCTVIFNSLAFMGYRNYKQQKDILTIPTIPNKILQKLTHDSWSASPAIVSSMDITCTELNTFFNGNLLSSNGSYKGIPLKATLYNADTNVIEYGFLWHDSGVGVSTGFYTWAIKQTDLISSPTNYRTISSISYNNTNRKYTINFGGNLNQLGSIVIKTI